MIYDFFIKEIVNTLTIGAAGKHKRFRLSAIKADMRNNFKIDYKAYFSTKIENKRIRFLPIFKYSCQQDLSLF